MHPDFNLLHGMKIHSATEIITNRGNNLQVEMDLLSGTIQNAATNGRRAVLTGAVSSSATGLTLKTEANTLFSSGQYLMIVGTSGSTLISQIVRVSSGYTSGTNLLLDSTVGKSFDAGATVGAFNLYPNLVYNIKDYGAVGNGVTDDTTAWNTCIANATGVSGTVYLPRGRYRITQTGLYNGSVNIEGEEGSVLYLDYVNTGASIAFNFSPGTSIVNETEYLLSTDALTNSTGVFTSGYANFAAGDIMYVLDKSNGDRAGYEVREVMYVDPATSGIYFNGPLSKDHLVANTGHVVKIDARTINIKNLTVECSPTSDILYLFALQRLKHSKVENLNVINHRSTSSGTSISLQIQVGYNVQVINNTFSCVTGTWSGLVHTSNLAIQTIGIERGIVSNNACIGYAFGINYWQCVGGQVNGNVLKGRPDSIRGIKLVGSRFVTVNGNNLSNFSGGALKIEDSNRCTFVGNNIYNSEVGINLSSQAAAAVDDGSFNQIVGNRIENCTQFGISLDAKAQHTLITNNYIKGTGQSAINNNATLYTVIRDNYIMDYGTGYTSGDISGYCGILSNVAAQIDYNKLWGINSPTGVEPFFIKAGNTPASGATFTNNWSIHKGMADTSDFWRFAQCHGNTILGMGQGEIFHSAPPSGTSVQYAGNKVWNSNVRQGEAWGWVCYQSGTTTGTFQFQPMGFVPQTGALVATATGTASGYGDTFINNTGAISFTLPSLAEMSDFQYKGKRFRFIDIIGAPNVTYIPGSGTTLAHSFVQTQPYSVVNWELFGTVWRMT